MREETEFYKSIALAMDDISINSLVSTWQLRNRTYSLSQAKSYGVQTAIFKLLKNHSILVQAVESNPVVKSIGNCYVGESIEHLDPVATSFLKLETDDGESAAIFPASQLNHQEIQTYLDCFGTAFLQENVPANSEYRCYIIGDELFTYQRDCIEGLDQSAAEYIATDYQVSSTTIRGLKNLMSNFSLGYLNFDLIVNHHSEEVLIDLNPYGSMPAFELFPEPSFSLANLMLNKCHE